MLTPLYKKLFYAKQCPRDLTGRCQSSYLNCSRGDSERRCPTYCSVLSLGEPGFSSRGALSMSFHSRDALHPITLTAFSLPACSSEVGLHVSLAHFRILWGIFSPPKPGDGGGDLNPLCGGLSPLSACRDFRISFEGNLRMRLRMSPEGCH